ncbi:hypothetical protein C1645_729141 [Glomus cerebriforme]|uniref:Sequence orphan n=1 Tax=Glomus cerebriforme TaxID=658196 RepID=A0A397SD69_9GLOM|nr:hypothetical protein C1645_729141 [Glomus cerebriforme]
MIYLVYIYFIMIFSHINFSLLFLVIFLLNLVKSSCYEHPDPLNYFHVERIPCPYTINLDSQDTHINYGENMFNITFYCNDNDLILCNKAKKTFEMAGQIISETLILNTKIDVNATFFDLCGTDKEQCKNISFRRIIGAAGPARSIILRDDDGVDRLYPQSLVKQFRFKNHPEYGQFDINAKFNSKVDYWFIEDNLSIGKNQIDFLYVVLHEFIHGLGFLSSWDNKNGFASGWEDYMNDRPEALTPEISISSSDATRQFKFNGFLESAFDRYMIHIPTGNKTSAFTGELNKFQEIVGVNFQNEVDFVTKFHNSPQYQIAKTMMSFAVSPNTLGFLPRGATKADDAIILETSLQPYQQGSSVSHVDLKTYNNTGDFLMKFLADHGANLDNLIAARIGNNNGGHNAAIGPKLKLVLETLG